LLYISKIVFTFQLYTWRYLLKPTVTSLSRTSHRYMVNSC